MKGRNIRTSNNGKYLPVAEFEKTLQHMKYLPGKNLVSIPRNTAVKGVCAFPTAENCSLKLHTNGIEYLFTMLRVERSSGQTKRSKG